MGRSLQYAALRAQEQISAVGELAHEKPQLQHARNETAADVPRCLPAHARDWVAVATSAFDRPRQIMLRQERGVNGEVAAQAITTCYLQAAVCGGEAFTRAGRAVGVDVRPYRVEAYAELGAQLEIEAALFRQ